MELLPTEREKLVGMVREVSVAEKIYLLGWTVMRRETESVFAAQMPVWEYVTHHLPAGGGERCEGDARGAGADRGEV